METTKAEKDNKEKVVMDIMVTEKVVDIMVEKAIMAVMEKAIMVVVEKAVAIMVEVKATMVASDSIIAHPIAIGTT